MSSRDPSELDDEARYRRTAELDAAEPFGRAALLAALGDASWRVRSAAVDRLGAAVEPASVLPALVDRAR
jgi:hypothetical protein